MCRDVGVVWVGVGRVWVGVDGRGWAWACCGCPWVGLGGRGWGLGMSWVGVGGRGWAWVGVGGRGWACQAVPDHAIAGHLGLPVSTSDQHVHIALCRSECLTSIPVMHMMVRGPDRHSDSQYAGQSC